MHTTRAADRRFGPAQLTASPCQLRRSVGKRHSVSVHAAEQLETRQLLAVDPISSNHPIFFASYGTPRLDGVVNVAEWASAKPVTRAQASQYDSQITLRYMYNERGLFVSADAKDDRVWADGNGRGRGNLYEFAEDDGLGLYFDPTNTRKRFLPTEGRFLGLNLGLRNQPREGDGVVSRVDFLRGNARGWGVNVNPDGSLTPGLKWRSRIFGTVNNNADIDQGWSIEVFFPWTALGMSGMPSNGQSIGTNFQAFFDNTGGTRNAATADTSTDPNVRLGARIVDDEIQGVFSSFDYSWSGFRGPINYAQLVFSNPFQADAPQAVGSLSTSSVNGYGARINFVSPSASQVVNLPGADGGATAASYQIRLSSSGVISDDATWLAATTVQNTFVPRPSGQAESLRIGNLTPSTSYSLAVRAVDAAGRLGPITTTTFTTESITQDPSGGERVLVSPAGGQLVTESGQPWVMVGSHAVVNTRYVRNAYPGDVWNPTGRDFTNFSINPGLEGGVSGYFDKLAEYGVNTLRVPLEWIALENSAAARSRLPSGMYWLEYPAGNFNPAMRSYLTTMMTEAKRTGIKLILHPFGNFNYGNFFELTAYARQNGGPLDSLDSFYQNSTVLEMAANRMRTIIDWVNQSGISETVIGYEPVNEWDTQVTPAGAPAPSQRALVNEQRSRSLFMTQLSARIRAYDRDVLLIHTGTQVVPRGPVARTVFYSDAFDVLAPHWYTRTTSEPVNNPDADKSVRSAIDYAGLAQYWTSQRRDNRPVHNGEWSTTPQNWTTPRTYYTGISAIADPARPWTLAQDIAMFRTTGWASLVSGTAGGGLRLAGPEIRELIPSTISPTTTGYLPLPLPTGMRQIQHSMSRFISDTGVAIDWANFDPTSLAGRIGFGGVSMTGTARSLLGFGSTDGTQGLAYVLKNGNVVNTNVDGASMSIAGLAEGAMFAIEVWSAGANASVLSRMSAVNVVGGRLSFALPTIAADAVIKFKRIS